LDIDGGFERGHAIRFILKIEDLAMYVFQCAAKGIPVKMMAADLLAIVIHAADGFGREVQQAAKAVEGHGRLHGWGDEHEAGHLVVRAAFQQEAQSQAAERVADIGVKGTMVLLDRAQDLDVVGKEKAFAAGIAMCRGVEGHHFTAFLEQIRQVVLEKPGAGFPSMCEQYLFDRGFGRQPATAADAVSVMVEGELVAFPE